MGWGGGWGEHVSFWAIQKERQVNYVVLLCVLVVVVVVAAAVAAAVVVVKRTVHAFSRKEARDILLLLSVHVKRNKLLISLNQFGNQSSHKINLNIACRGRGLRQRARDRQADRLTER